MSSFKSWIVSFRLRTLPLALACVGMGSILAVDYRIFNWKIFTLTVLTAIFLQVLSNLANDYGDTVKGTDNEDRVGPQRALQSGEISLKAMRNAIVVCAILALFSGIGLLTIAMEGQSSTMFIVFLLIGLACIAAAIKYTVGEKPYGYSGFGDIAVFIFFGLVGVGGTFYLYAHALPAIVLLPASALGFLSAGVLNINNMRDIDNDAAAGKRTIVVRMGLANAKKYHAVLILMALVFLFLYTQAKIISPLQMLYLVVTPLFMIHLVSVLGKESEAMDSNLKQLAIFTLILVICFGLNIVLCA
jgi:1,4-dihydroxy-2-naphthoate octaprenyltransferase